MHDKITIGVVNVVKYYLDELASDLFQSFIEQIELSDMERTSISSIDNEFSFSLCCEAFENEIIF